MGEAIGQVLVYAVGVGLSPLAIVGSVVILSSPRGRANGPAYVGGWVGGLAVAGVLLLLVSKGAGAHEGVGEADWVDVLKLVLGLGLLVAAARRYRSGREGERRTPGWMRDVDRFTGGRSAALGAALGVVNPKNLVLVVAAAASIAETGASSGAEALALLVFVVVGSLGVGAPVVLYLVQGERARDRLDRLRAWMIEHDGAAIAVLLLLIGAKLIGDSISGLTA